MLSLQTGDSVLSEERKKSRVFVWGARHVEALSPVLDPQFRIRAGSLIEIRADGVTNKTQRRQAAFKGEIEKSLLQSQAAGDCLHEGPRDSFHCAIVPRQRSVTAAQV